MIEHLERMTGMVVYPRSLTETETATYFLAREGEGKRLGIVGEASGFEGQRRGEALVCPLTHDAITA